MFRDTAPSTAVRFSAHSGTLLGSSARSHCLRSLVPLAILVAGLLAAVSSASAAPFYWFGDDTSFWNTIAGPGGTNWSSSPDFNNGTGGATALPGSGDDVFFVLAGAGNLNTQLGANFSIQSLTFTPDATSPIQINDTPGTHSLTIGTGGITVNGPSTDTINASVVLGASQTWANNTASPFTVNGIISGPAANNLTIGGTGVTAFSGANTYGGSTNVFTGTLNLTGNGAILNSSAISLNAGTSLTLDNSATNINQRIGATTGITSRGGIFSLIGNGIATNQTVGTLTLGSGASVVQASGTGAVLTFGASGGSPIPSLSRSSGGTVNFVVGAGANVNLPNVTVTNGIIGGYAVTGTAAGTGLDWAALNGSNNVIPYTGYTQLTADANGAITSGTTGTAQQTNNIKYHATAHGTSPLITADTTINTLYMTGGSTPIPATNIPDRRAACAQKGDSLFLYNGITFGNGNGSQAKSQVPGTAVTLTIGAGGIISSGATGVGYYNNKADIANMGFVGYLFGESNTTNTGGTTTDIGQITVPAGVPDLSVYTASDGNLRLASVIVDTPVTVTGTTTARLTNASNIVKLTGTATTAAPVVDT
jgi:fibronectin-binding autotransporter adhesin